MPAPANRIDVSRMTAPEVDLRHGDCREIIAAMPDCSVDAIVTDPPYELGFMGKKWDATGIAYDVSLWSECLRVLKPGGHLLAFGGTRTYHRLACAIEDAGFEIRDSIYWLYSSGFPKSLDVSKSIDKMDAREEQKARRFRFTAWVQSTGVTAQQIDNATETKMGSHYTTHPTQPAVMTVEHLNACRHLFGEVPEWVELEAEKRSVQSRNFASREVVGERSVPVGHAFAGPTYGNDSSLKSVAVTKSATDAAREWEGWGTALKPAHEPIALARKLLTGTVAANVSEYGTGALNIDVTRIPMGDEYDPTKIQRQQKSSGAIEGAFGAASLIGKEIPTYNARGRWPANVITDGSIEAEWVRYFFTAKASKGERNAGGTIENRHPTVKPLALMRYLVRLVTPPGGTVLEPFAGSGTTLAAAILEGFNAIGCELTEDYLPIINGRVQWAHEQRANKPESLFPE